MSDLYSEAIQEQWNNIRRLYMTFERENPIILYDLQEKKLYAFPYKKFKAELSEKSQASSDDSLPNKIGRRCRGDGSQWVDHKDARLGAALAYYSIFSIGPLILIAVAIAGLLFGQDAVRGEVSNTLRGMLGDQHPLPTFDLGEHVDVLAALQLTHDFGAILVEITNGTVVPTNQTDCDALPIIRRMIWKRADTHASLEFRSRSFGPSCSACVC
jgi:hypothetical protein